MKRKTFKDFVLILCIAIVQLFTLFMLRPIYETNDDLTIVSILSGQYGQTAYPDGIFISKFLSEILFILYNIKYLPWYSCLLYVLQTIALFLVIKIIFRVVSSNYLKITLLVLLFVLYQHVLLKLSFTSTGLFLCVSTSTFIGMKVLIDDKFSKKEIFIAILFSISFLLRPSIYYIYILFTIPVFGFVLMGKNVKRILSVFLPIIFIVTASITYDHISRNTPDYHYFEEFNSARSKFHDTALGNYNEQTEEALSSVNWTIEEYKLGKAWFMHNEQIFNPASINKFLEANAEERSQLMSFDKMKTYLTEKDIMLLFAVLFVISILVIKLNNNVHLYRSLPFNKIYFYLSLVYVSLGILSLCSIRFPGRIAYPLGIYLILLIILFSPFIGKKVNNIFWSRILITSFLTFGITSLTLVSILNVHYSEITSMKKEYIIASTEKVLSMNGDETVFVQITPHSFTKYVHPLKEFNDIPKYNNLPDGWMINSPTYNAYLNKYGVESGKEFIDFSINNDNVIYTFYETFDRDLTEYEKILENYLNNHHAVPNKKLTFNIYYDDRISNNNGLIYFKLVTE